MLLESGLFHNVNTAYTIFAIMLLYNLTTLCHFHGTLSCVNFMDVNMEDRAKSEYFACQTLF